MLITTRQHLKRAHSDDSGCLTLPLGSKVTFSDVMREMEHLGGKDPATKWRALYKLLHPDADFADIPSPCKSDINCLTVTQTPTFKTGMTETNCPCSFRWEYSTLPSRAAESIVGQQHGTFE